MAVDTAMGIQYFRRNFIVTPPFPRPGRGFFGFWPLSPSSCRDIIPAKGGELLKTSKLADKIISFLYREFVKTGEKYYGFDKILKHFEKIPTHLLQEGLLQLELDGLVSVLYGDNEPDTIFLKSDAIRQCDENTLLKKGYDFVKELREWL